MAIHVIILYLFIKNPSHHYIYYLFDGKMFKSKHQVAESYNFFLKERGSQ